MVLADPGFVYQKPKLPPLEGLVPTPWEVWAPSSPTLVTCPLFLSTIHRQTDGTGVRPSCHAPMPGGNWRRGRATNHGQVQAKYLALSKCPRGRKKQWSSTWSRKEPISLSPRSTKHSALHCPSSLPHLVAKGLKSGKEARPAEQDVGGEGKEGFINKRSNIESEGEGKEEGCMGRGWSPEREAEACTVSEKIASSLIFF